MMRVSGCAGLLATVLLGPLAHAAAPDGAPAAQVPAAAFAMLPQVSAVQLSPDGNLLAWLDQSGPVGKVVVLDLTTKKFLRTLGIDPKMTLRSVQWADDHTLLMTVSALQVLPAEEGRRRYTFYRTMSVDVDSGKSCVLLMAGGGIRAWVTGAHLLAWHTARPHTVIMDTLDYSYNEYSVASELFEVDTQTGRGKEIEEGDRYTEQWVVDPAGNPVARSEWRPEAHAYLVQARDGDGWRIIQRRADDEMTLYGVSADGKSVIATGPGQDGWVELWAIALDGSGAKQMRVSKATDANVDVEDVLRDRFSGLPVGALLGGLEPRTWWFDPGAQRTHEIVARAFPGHDVVIYSRSEDGARVVARVEGPSSPPVYYLIDFKSRRADIIGESYPALDHVRLGQVSNMTYPARDGTQVPAYLTLPPGVTTPKGLPMVVLPHGGPNERDVPEFYWLAQFLAVRGYAVLQPQYRGSFGFGETFSHAGKGQLGGLTQDDITDGVKAMIGRGIADPRHICIVGIDYGGYAALAGAAFTPGLYACAVSINGISDISAFLGFQQAQFGSSSADAVFWKGEIGSRFDESVIDRSPINSVADVDAPVLLLHGTDDTYVPYTQSQRMAGALATLGKSVALVKLEGDDHWLSKSATRLEVLDDLGPFLHQYLQ